MAVDVLVVDDDPSVCEMIAQALDLEGITYSLARNGAEALARLEEQVPAVILLDINMPVLDGAAFSAELDARGLRERVAVVVMTADSRVSYYDRFCGADDVLAKPFDLDRLYTVIARLQDQSRRVHA